MVTAAQQCDSQRRPTGSTLRRRGRTNYKRGCHAYGLRVPTANAKHRAQASGRKRVEWAGRTAGSQWEQPAHAKVERCCRLRAWTTNRQHCRPEFHQQLRHSAAYGCSKLIRPRLSRLCCSSVIN